MIDHLTELRRRLIVSSAAVGGGAVLSFLLYGRILRFLQNPYCAVTRASSRSCMFLVTSPLQPFAVRLQVATYCGLIVASPIVLFQLWRFVAPAMSGREKRYAIPFVMSTIVLFCIGGLLAYLTFPKALDFLVHIGGGSLDVRLDPSRYLGLILLMILAFGLSFEFPVFLVFLELVGVLPSSKLRSWRRPAAVGIVAFAAVITPSQDPYSLFAMAIPMLVFYEGAILIGRILGK